MEQAIIPQNYEEWRHCIIVGCGLELTADYVNERLSSLQDDKDFRTQQFIRLYGRAHTQNIIGWFKQTQNSL